jgi:aldehyde dehydrogenase (NAD+)
MSDVVPSLIGDEWIEGPGRRPIENPARPTEVVWTSSMADAALAARAVDAARASALAWSRTPAPARADLLLAVAQLLVDRAGEIGRDMAREEGKTLAEAVGEARGSAAQFRYAAGRALEPIGAVADPRDQRTAMLWAQREPLGVVACITPWNFPISIPAWKLAHALAAGNTVVWKPAETTPRTSWHLARAFLDAGFPAGVVNMLLGEGSHVGDVLTRHPAIDGVSFTGSTAVGTRIATAVAPARVRVQLEMGGSNPAIVLPDADLDLAAEEISQGAFSSTGQKCTATARVLVVGDVFQELVERLRAKAAGWVMGDPLDPATTLGPITSRAQFRQVVAALRTAPASALVSGGAPSRAEDDGFFVSPTVFAGVEPDAPIVNQEVFGPVTSLVRADGVDEAVAVANSSPYGLSASVFTNDIDRALRIAEELDSGVVKINKATTGNEIHVPFGGRKESGFGPPEMGWPTWDFYTRWKTVYVGRRG